ncbi:MAG: hypothetical protein HY811_00685 [Planctomycetes bacterium]|nr:hypothetical protein [Planctomycetota bacterium]
MERIPTRHVLQNTVVQWIVSIAIYLALGGFFMWYYSVRGYSYDLFTVNKGIALAALFSICISISLGPLSRFIIFIGKLLPYRRTLGMIGAYMVVAHITLSFFFLPEIFPLEWFLEHWPTIIFCIPAVLLLLMIALLSYPSGFKWLVKKKLQFFPKFVWLALGFALGHILFLGKIPDWIEWIKTFYTPLPHATLPASIFCIIVLFLKLLDIIWGKRNH